MVQKTNIAAQQPPETGSYSFASTAGGGAMALPYHLAVGPLTQARETEKQATKSR